METIKDKKRIIEIMDRPENAKQKEAFFKQHGGEYPDWLMVCGDVIIVYGIG